MKYFLSKSLIFLIFFLIFVLFTACSENQSGLTTGDISTSVNQEGITISNNSDSSVYYFAVDQSAAAYIYWVPVSNQDNQISPREEKLISFDSVEGFENSKTVNLYYWTSENPGNEDVQLRTLEIDN